MSDKKAADVSTPSAAYMRMKPDWDRADVLLGGTPSLRAAGKDYLPQHPAESDKNYRNRLAQATLLNVFEGTLTKLSGKPFDKDMVLGDDVPPAIAELLQDVDLQGTALQPFCHRWFRMGWAKGFAHVLVDHPVRVETVGADGKPRQRTLDDDRRENLRPYWVLIRPENVIAMYGEMVNGRERLVHVRILETSVERDGYEEAEVHRVRVLEPGTWELHKMSADGKRWEIENSGPTGLDEIPLRTFYAGKREALMEAKPPLADLAHLNITHWQSSSDQRNVLTVARFPILAGKGIDDDSKVEIGPNNYLTSTEGGEWYYVEHSGAAIEAGRKDLEDLENQMAMYGSEALRRKTGTETATARAIDSAEATSDLGASVKAFQDCVEECMQLTAKWMGLETGGTVGFHSIDEEPPGADAPTLTALKDARASRDISRETYLGELKRRGVLAEEFDVDEDKEELEREEPTDGLGGMFDKGNGVPAVPGEDD